MATHPNWTAVKHPRLPNGQWAPKRGMSVKRFRARVRVSDHPRSYASRNHVKPYMNHNARLKSQTTKAARRRAVATVASVAAVTGTLAAAAYIKHTASGGPITTMPHTGVKIKIKPRYTKVSVPVIKSHYSF